jgi:hypothetical protein
VFVHVLEQHELPVPHFNPQPLQLFESLVRSTHVFVQQVLSMPWHVPLHGVVPESFVVVASLPVVPESFGVVPESLFGFVASGRVPESVVMSSSLPACVPVAHPVANAQPTTEKQATTPTKRMTKPRCVEFTSFA